MTPRRLRLHTEGPPVWRILFAERSTATDVIITSPANWPVVLDITAMGGVVVKYYELRPIYYINVKTYQFYT